MQNNDRKMLHRQKIHSDKITVKTQIADTYAQLSGCCSS